MTNKAVKHLVLKGVAEEVGSRHANSRKLLKKLPIMVHTGDGSFATVELDLGHVVRGGKLLGEPAITVGSRGGNKAGTSCRFGTVGRRDASI